MRRKYVAVVILFLSGFVLSALYTNMDRPLVASKLNIYLSPSGNDSADGLTTKTAILSLKRAHVIAAARMKSKPTDIIVNVASGTYYNQPVVWTAVHKDFYVIIKGTSPYSRPRFDGRADSVATLGASRAFFVLNARGGMSNLTIENLSITYYAEAISFNGSREATETGYNGSNKIIYNQFDKIGSMYMQDKTPAYAVVRFLNSRNNLVSGNTFTNIHNIAANASLLHSLYIASYSSNNNFTGNVFRSQSGDPIRIRDFSNFNNITSNEIDRAGSVGYSEWYCEQASQSNCTKDVPECPSWGNTFTKNNLKSVAAFKIYINPTYDAKSSACKLAAPAAASGKRLRTASNVSDNSTMVATKLNESLFFNFCPASNNCVNSVGKCYASKSGTGRWLCDQNRWRLCATDSDIGSSFQGIICQRQNTGIVGWSYK
jgi:hypothetical protein